MNSFNPPLHPSIERAVQEIDAALFSGDDLHNEHNREVFRAYFTRWLERVEEVESWGWEGEDGA